MLVQFLSRFAIPILLVLIFFFLLFIVVFLLHRRSRKIMEEDPIITSLENNNVDSFLRAIHEIDQTESGPEEVSPKQIEGDEDTLVHYVSDSDSEDENREDENQESGESNVKNAIGSFLGGIGLTESGPDQGLEEAAEEDSDIGRGSKSENRDRDED